MVCNNIITYTTLFFTFLVRVTFMGIGQFMFYSEQVWICLGAVPCRKGSGPCKEADWRPYLGPRTCTETKTIFACTAQNVLDVMQNFWLVNISLNLIIQTISNTSNKTGIQECIPVGWLLPALHRTEGSPWQTTPLDRDPPGQRLPLDRDPLDRYHPWTETYGQRPPGQRAPGQRPPVNGMTHRCKNVTCAHIIPNNY